MLRSCIGRLLDSIPLAQPAEGDRSARPAVGRNAAVIGLLTVVAANFLYLSGLSLLLDPMVSMDSYYIQMAQRPLASILAEAPAWGPLYAVWLKPFTAALGDPLAVYAANVYALSFGVSLLIYLYLLLLTRRVAVAAGAALFFLPCDLNVPLSNKVSGFALMVTLAGLTASELAPAGARRMSVAAAGILFASYVRPEFYPAALALCLAAAWMARKEFHESGRRTLLWPGTVGAALLLGAVWPGPPLSAGDSSSGRLFMALREHFAWNWSSWHNQGRDVFSIWGQEFGGAESTLAAFLTNPWALLHHVLNNVLGTAGFLAASAFDHYPLLLPANRPVLVKAESLLVAAAVFGGVFVVMRRPELRGRLIDRYGHTLLPYVALTACSVGAATAVFPQAYYLVIPAVLLMLAGALAATLIIPEGFGLSPRQRAVAVIVCLVAFPRPFVLPSAHVASSSPFQGRVIVARAVTDTIGVVRSLGLPAPVHVLSFTDGIAEMLGTGFHEVKIWQKGAQPLEVYIRDKDVGAIISLGAGRESSMDNDPDWRAIQITPERIGFVRVPVPNNDGVGVYVRADLMPPRR